MKKILLILSLALIIPFTGISQKYDGVQSLYVNSEEFPEQGGDRAGWFGWSLGAITTWISISHWPEAEQGIFNRFEPEDLTSRIGEYIFQVSYSWTYYNQPDFQNYPVLWANPRIRVYTGGYFNSSEDYDRGNLVADVEAPMPPNSSNWQNVTLPEPILITGTEEVWFGVVHYWEDGHIFKDVTGVNGAPLTPEEIASCIRPLKSDLVYFGDEDEFFSYGQEVPGETSSWYVRANSKEMVFCDPATNLNVAYSEETCDAVLSWTAPADDPNAKYNIYRDNLKITASPISTTSYTDKGFNAADGHTWEVKVVCSTGNETAGIPKSLGKCADCNAPTNVKAEYKSCTLAEITWDAVDGATKYIVYRDDVEKETVTGTKYSDIENGGFNANTTWKVVTVCATGVSEKSDGFSLPACGNSIRDNEITFSIHPNPATTKITITAGNIFNTVDIVNFLGQTVISQNTSNDNVEIDVSNLNSGVYFVRIASENGVSVQKFVKK